MKDYFVILLLSLSIGCASYQSFDQDTSRPAYSRLGAHKTTKGLIIAAENYSEPKKSEKYFDRDLKNEGYLPIYVCISNQGGYEFSLRLQEDIVFNYEDGTTASVADPQEVIEEVQRSGAITLLALPFAIIPTPILWNSISNANFDLSQDYEKKSLKNINITKEDKELFGFIFVKIPEDLDEKSVKDSFLQMQITKKAQGKETAEVLKFKVPISQN